MILLLVVMKLMLSVAQEGPGTGGSHHLPVESHHSLYPPMDASLHYWSFGGSTVAARSFLRLTPSVQSRTGWLVNEFAIGSKDWEMQVALSVRSAFYIGGDGFAIWVLDRSMIKEPDKEHYKLEGNVLGMREDFNGFGVIFDTYDNNGDRNNPTVSVLMNDGTMKEWENDEDFQSDRVKAAYKDFDTSCTLEYRNEQVDTQILLRYQSGVLHVYTDLGGEGFKACLAVRLDKSTLDTHSFAFTALTGAVADIHEIRGITTRYLDSTDPELDDWSLARQGSVTRSAWKSALHWVLCVIFGTWLVWMAYQDFKVFQSNIKKNTALLCSRINVSRQLSSKVCAGLYVWLVITGSYTAVLLGTPKFLIHTWEFMTSYNLDPSAISKLNRKNVGKDPLTYLYVELGSTTLSLTYFLWRVIFP